MWPWEEFVHSYGWTDGVAESAFDAVRELQVSVNVSRALKIFAGGVLLFHHLTSYEPRVDEFVLVEEVAEVGYKVADDGHVVHWFDRDDLAVQVGNLSVTGEFGVAVDLHSA